MSRTCVKDYRIPGTPNIIEKGVEVFIPTHGLQRDEKYYPQPTKFDPERFDEESSAEKYQINRPYLPFGDGGFNLCSCKILNKWSKMKFIGFFRTTKLHWNENGEITSKNWFTVDVTEIQLRAGSRFNGQGISLRSKVTYDYTHQWY